MAVSRTQLITPQPQAKKLATALGLTVPLYLKREDLHPYGSHKGRSIPAMIDRYAKNGEVNFVISSSGNAALAAALFIKKLNRKRKNKLNLKIFVGKNIDKEKILSLRAQNGRGNLITVLQTANPKQSAFLATKSGGCLLRQSTDNSALTGYAGLAQELGRIEYLKAVFIPTSSGTTTVGLFRASRGKVQLHIVQTSACHPFIKSDQPHAKSSLASAIVDKIGHRKKEILVTLKKSHGAGYIATDKEIKNAIKLAYQTEKIKLSPNSALALVGLKQALENGWQPKGAVALLITSQ